MSKAPCVVAGVSANAGTRAQALLDLSFSGVATRLPLFVLNGALPGPAVVVTAGIHGSEYVGIEGAYRLALQTDPAQLRGQLIVAPISSMTAYAKRATYLAPPDNKNLNRCFPGNATGSFAEQLADWIFQTLIKRADFYVDCHGGDLNEALVPFSICSRTGDAALDARAIALAEAFGIAEIVVVEVGGSTVGAAAKAGIPAVLVEIGGQGLWSDAEAAEMHAGLRRALAFAGAIDHAYTPTPARIMSESAWLRSEHDGLFYSTVKVGDTVAAGQRVGHVANFLGETVQVAIAPAAGRVMFLVTTLAMNAGDPLLAVMD